MPIRMPSSLTLLLLALAGPAAETTTAAGSEPSAGLQAPSASVLSAAERTALDTAAMALIGAGYPDTAGADLVIGTVTIGMPAPPGEPGKEADDEPGLAGMRARLIDDRLVAECSGAHLRCRDGAWVIDGYLVWHPSDGRSVQATPEATVQPAADWRGAAPNDPVDHRRLAREDGWLPGLPAAVAARRSAMRTAARAIEALPSDWTWGLAPLALHRAGMAGAGERALLNAQEAAQPDWNDRPDAPRILNLGRRSPSPRETVSAPRQELIAPTAAAAAWIAGWLDSLLDDRQALAASGMDPATVVAHRASLGDPADRAEHERVARLRLARLELSEEIAADAPLAEQLRRWNGRRDEDAWQPQPEHLPELLALLDDGSAAVPMPDGWPRCLGDQALAAIAAILRFDPRHAVGRDPAASYTAAERAATSAAVQAWLAGRQPGDIPALLLATIPTLDARGQLALLASRIADHRPPLAEAIAPGWSSPRADCDAWTLAGMLDLASPTPAFAAAIAGWQDQHDALGDVLAVWHDIRGARERLDARLGASPPTAELVGAWEQAGKRPDARRLMRALVLLAEAPMATGWAPIAGALDLEDAPTPPAWRAAAGLDELPEAALDAPLRARSILPLAALCLLLQDDRPLPNAAATIRQDPDDDDAWLEIRCNGIRLGCGIPASRRDRPAPTDLRCFDLALVACARLGGRHLPHSVELPGADLWAPLAERRSGAAAASIILADLLRPTLDAAKLPDILPVLPPDHGPSAIF